jgi:hypothetical protein
MFLFQKLEYKEVRHLNQTEIWVKLIKTRDKLK